MNSILGKHWREYEIPDRLIIKKRQDFKIGYILAKLFLQKNFTNEETYHTLNNKKLINEIDINVDFKKGANFLNEIIDTKSNVLIFGDYDVDGYSSTFLLYKFITSLNIDCDYYIPDRFKDGYGPNEKLLFNLIKKKKYSLIIFVDCGSNSINEISFLNKKKIKTIVIDHHQIYKINENSNSAIINPLKYIKYKKYHNFCATSLVYFFIKFLNSNLKKKVVFNDKKYLFFVAMATICDQMALRDINRIIVNKGLNNFNIFEDLNLKYLFKLKKKINSSDIAFYIGPIINSAARLGHHDLPIKLFTENNLNNVKVISKKLISLNEKRKLIQKELFDKLNQKISVMPDEAIFIYEDNINVGLLGIISGKLVELYEKPSFILTKVNNLIKCSSRSLNNFDIGKLFNKAIDKKILLNGGGHSMAGGCTLKKDKLHDFKKFINYEFKKNFKKKEITYYSCELSLNSLKSFAKFDFQKLEPFGNKNISPFFLIKNNRIIKHKILNKLHLQIIIKNNYNVSCMCVLFYAVGTKLGDFLINYKKKVDLIVQINSKVIKKNSDFNLIIKDVIA